MNSLIALSLTLNLVKATYLNYAFGYEQRFDYEIQTFDCRTGATSSYTYSINYGGSFERIPKIIITDAYYGVDYQQPAEFRFSLQGETTEGFSMLVSCPQVNRFYFLRFNWTAIDDKRIEVINVFNVAMVGVTSQLYKFNHDNPNALQGFITLTSFGYGGAINVSVDIISISKSEVSVQFTTTNDKLLSLGYQIVLGTSQTFNQSNSIVSHITSSSFYQSGTLTIPSGQKLITPISGFYFPDFGTLHYRLRRIYSESSTTIVYRWENWDGSYQDLSHKQVWLNLPITYLFTPMLAKKMRGMKNDNPWVVKQDIMKLTIVELNKSFKVSSDSSSFDTDQQVLNMIVYFKCGYWQRVQGSILTCTNCQNKFITLNQNCYKKINEAAYYIKFVQKDSVHQSLDVAVTSTGFTITQKIINQIQESYTLLSFQIQNQ